MKNDYFKEFIGKWIKAKIQKSYRKIIIYCDLASWHEINFMNSIFILSEYFY